MGMCISMGMGMEGNPFYERVRRGVWVDMDGIPMYGRVLTGMPLYGRLWTGMGLYVRVCPCLDGYGRYYLIWSGIPLYGWICMGMNVYGQYALVWTVYSCMDGMVLCSVYGV